MGLTINKTNGCVFLEELLVRAQNVHLNQGRPPFPEGRSCETTSLVAGEPGSRHQLEKQFETQVGLSWFPLSVRVDEISVTVRQLGLDQKRPPPVARTGAVRESTPSKRRFVSLNVTKVPERW